MTKKASQESRRRLPGQIASLSLAGLLLAGIFIACGGKRGGPVPVGAARGHCPVCKMSVKASDRWTSEISYKDGTKLMFESPGDMFSFYTSPARYDVPDSHKDRASIEKIIVKDYNTGNPVELEQASFAYESKVNSPMGPDLIPFAYKKDGLLFIEENGGRLISSGDVTPEIVRNLRRE
ncbi:MAG TPA: nitrous oxide reductase accessory protein NosL [Blastocatellia bacterium]|nr:nitrous oxide reductase accessory protein NosL [Blastocatellia bacterium]